MLVDKSYKDAYHRQSAAFAQVIRAKTLAAAKMAVVDCDLDTEEIFLSAGIVTLLRGQEKPPSASTHRR